MLAIVAAIGTALAAGCHDFGENRLEELWEKVQAARAPELAGLRWHLIGPIQSRKSREAIGPYGPFALVHAVDRTKIAQRLSRDAEAANCVLAVLLEVNVSGEATKRGVAREEALNLAREIALLEHLSIRGLMTMAPWFDDPEAARPYFTALRILRDRIAAADIPGVHMEELSMGMSGDFEAAVAEGATIVRIGRSLFGERPPR